MPSPSLAGFGQSHSAPVNPMPPDAAGRMADVSMEDADKQEVGGQKDQPTEPVVPEQPSVSFKEKLLANQQPIPTAETSDFVLEAGDIQTFMTPEGPAVKISDRYRAHLHKNWENTLIVKLWGRNIRYQSLCNRLPNLWKLRGAVKVIDLDYNFYLVRVHNNSDSIELDLLQPLQSKISVDGKWYFISYEKLPDVCFECGLLGHNMAVCPQCSATGTNLASTEAATPAAAGTVTGACMIDKGPSAALPPPCPSQTGTKYGPWMVVQPRQRRPPRQAGETGARKETTQSS
ncbi:hypothetical protein Tsubulata_002265 [Turnera subulata]|uniref:CCHC-type domain-containing protein n=1 Tax=Turnera subulata TaxID=218843 RepID=A0A9Q0FXL0_9ROSI|nr:hypothetical protein Tsubulata_002265 [Turnera subulata]